MNLNLLFFIFLAYASAQKFNRKWSLIGNPLFSASPCIGNNEVSISYEPGLAPERENEYGLFINGPLPEHTVIKIKFDAPANMTLTSDIGDVSRVNADNKTGMFYIKYFKGGPYFNARVHGLNMSIIPYPTTINVNFAEYCDHPAIGILDEYIQGYRRSAASTYTEHDEKCGRVKIECGGNDEAPWLAEIKYNNSVICAGTLVFNNFILTAAQCVTELGVVKNSSLLTVVLGNFNKTTGDIVEEFEVEKIYVYDDYNYENGTNNIALIELKEKVEFTETIQPACLWEFSAYKNLPTKNIEGTVITKSDENADETLKIEKLKKFTSDAEVDIYRHDKFGKTFNASSNNGSELCKLVGSGFTIFVPDTPGSSTGAWYVQGIVTSKDSLQCDSTNPTQFTDLDYYRGWVLNKKNKSYSIV